MLYIDVSVVLLSCHSEIVESAHVATGVAPLSVGYWSVVTLVNCGLTCHLA